MTLYQISNIKYQIHILNIKNLKIFNVLYVFFIFSILFFIFSINTVNAQTSLYPIRELDNCRNERECHLYCQIPINTPACWSYGKYILNANVLGESTTADNSDITYPVKELGNCNSASECFVFCSQPQNQKTCYDFAVSRGLIKEKPKVPDNIIELAKKELGCKSDLECMVFCQIPQNMDACRSFGQKYNLVPPPDKNKMGPPPEVVEDAKKVLGCDSDSSCMNFCNNPENGEKCFEFAKKHDLIPKEELAKHDEWKTKEKELMEDAKKEFGCDSPQTCKPICEKRENMDKCMKIAQKHGLGPPPPPAGGPPNPNQPNREYRPANTGAEQDGGIQPKSFDSSGSPSGQSGQPMGGAQTNGPGGCTSEKECREYCDKHPNDCPGFKDKQQSQPDNTNFQGPGGCKSEKECKEYCEKNPKDCPQKSQPPNSQQSPQSPQPPNSPNSSQSQPKQGDFLGPGGCKTEGECKAYCEKHQDECPGFPKEKRQDKPETKITPPNASGGQAGNPFFSSSYQKPPNQPPPPNQKSGETNQIQQPPQPPL